MLILLLPNQIGDYWELIKEGLGRSGIPVLNPNGLDTYANILAKLLEGKMLAYVVGDMVDGKIFGIRGTLVCSIVTDEASMTKNLLIYSLWNIQGEPKATWIEGLEVLKELAKVQDCTYIYAYTDVPILIEISKSLGADISQRLIRFEVM